MRLIKILKNDCKVVFDRGKFDGWCVYVVKTNGYKKAPTDEDYFTDLKSLNEKYGNNKVYNDFLKVYEKTSKDIESAVLDIIDEITNTYNPEDQYIIEQWFTVIYAGMIAEENKERAILKKRIKHLGVYQTLIQNYSPAEAAVFSKRKPWTELDELMKRFGF